MFNLTNVVERSKLKLQPVIGRRKKEEEKKLKL
jgi:hypothetical protein